VLVLPLRAGAGNKIVGFYAHGSERRLGVWWIVQLGSVVFCAAMSPAASIADADCRTTLFVVRGGELGVRGGRLGGGKGGFSLSGPVPFAAGRRLRVAGPGPQAMGRGLRAAGLVPFGGTKGLRVAGTVPFGGTKGLRVAGTVPFGGTGGLRAAGTVPFAGTGELRAAGAVPFAGTAGLRAATAGPQAGGKGWENATPGLLSPAFGVCRAAAVPAFATLCASAPPREKESR
jgi:hypothetical protein